MSKHKRMIVVAALTWFGSMAGLGLGAGLAGCGGSDVPVPMPSALLGTYTVMVESQGKTDPTTMTVVAGSGMGVVLTFTNGIGPIQCTVQGSTQVTIPRQQIEVDHATGVATGTATGTGKITAAAVDVTFHLTTAGISAASPDGGTGATSSIAYHITGAKAAP